jgi:hypothetical protein
MNFNYFLDPLCMACWLAYAVNRWLLKPHFHSGFFHDHFNDLFIIPCALPVILWVHRQFYWRLHDRPPQWREIMLHLVIWSVTCKWLAPHFFSRATYDPWDLVAYFSGGLFAWIWWNQIAGKSREAA